MNDLGKEKITVLLRKLAIPAITAQLINALYNIVDRIYIARIPDAGANALTGVGVCFPILMLISSFSALIGMGGAPLAAIEMGKKNHQKAERILSTAFSALVIVGIVLAVLLWIFREPILLAFGASNNTVSYGSDYLSIYLLGSVFVMLSIGMNAFITSQGFAKQSMMVVLIGAIINILFDPLFIFVFHFGVKGAALATILSQGISAFLVLSFLTGKKTILKIRLKYMKIDFKILGAITALGVSPFIMQSTESLLQIVMNSTLQKYGGDMAVGSMTIISSIAQFGIMPLSGLTQGGQPIISYNYGAANMERVKSSAKLLIQCSFIYSICYCLLCEIFADFLASIFTGDVELIETAKPFIRIYFAGFWMMGIQISCQQSFLALNEAKISLFLALLRKIVLLIPFIYLLSACFQTIGVFLAEPIADILAAITTGLMFIVRFKKLLKESEINQKV